MSDQVRIVTRGTLTSTEGLIARGHRELTLDACDAALIADGETYLRAVIDYLEESRRTLNPGDTFAYGYWLTSFHLLDNETLDVWEYGEDASGFVRGLRLTLTYWRMQHEVCAKYGADFRPPQPDKLAVVSAGVLEGDAVQAVRYPSPEHMSGWWFTTDRYDGNIKSLRTEHLYHVTAARADLAQYVALPFGFRFDLSHGEDVWFDEAVAL